MINAPTSADQLYRDDLAEIHIDGYGFHWEGAAPTILEWLKDHGLTGGVLVDLGCGGGQWLSRASQAGYETIGIDVSPSMIRHAKRLSPDSKFVCASFSNVEIPDCDAVTSLGEPLNYLNSRTLMQRTIRKVYASLRKNGLFVFDVRHPPAKKVDAINHVQSGDDWFCYARIEEDARSLTRNITTFRKIGSRYRRTEEIHHLKLVSKTTMLKWLRDAGFRVHRYPGYGDYQLLKRQSVFVCRKP